MSAEQKIDGYIPRHPKEGWLGSCIETVVVERDYETALDELLECRGNDEARRERIEEVKAEGWEIVPVRIVPASELSAAEVAAIALKGLQAVNDLIAESRGVDGLHRNGDLATWVELSTGGRFEEWLQPFDEALTKLNEIAAMMK